MLFQQIVEQLRTAIKNSQDIRLIPYYAEYLVACKLSELGYDAQVLKKRCRPDVIVKDGNKKIRVQVKSSHIDRERWACGASFYEGANISQERFEYCVFVVLKNLVEPVRVFTIYFR